LEERKLEAVDKNLRRKSKWPVHATSMWAKYGLKKIGVNQDEFLIRRTPWSTLFEPQNIEEILG